VTIGSWQDNFRTRIPSLSGFLERARHDRRNLAYDVLPLFASPGRRRLVARGLAAIGPKTAGFSPSAHARNWAYQLGRDGIVPSIPPVPDDRVIALRQYFESIACRDPYRAHLGSFRYDAPASPETNMGYYEAAQILAAPGVLDLFNDPVILETAELYLGCKPLIDNIGAWWSYPGRPAAKGTQRYHRDLDSFGGFKMFIYLTDVDADAGPHVFMKGSHLNPALPTGRACSDEAVRGSFGAGNEIAITGAAGSRFIADTFAFHKGLLPGQGRRLLLTAQYNVNASPHLPPEPLLSRKAGYDRDINRLIMRG
jgi:hypothetical protein